MMDLQVYVPTAVEGSEGTLEGFFGDDDDASLTVESYVSVSVTKLL